MSERPVPVVFVVDSDASVRESLELLSWNAGWETETFASASEFLAFPKAAVPSCLILDLALPDLNGLDLQERVAAERSEMPIIFLAGHADIPTTVKAIKRGALELLLKPCDTTVMLGLIRQAIKRSEATLSRELELRSLRANFDSLSQREREVMTLVTSGLLNKEAGDELGISEITVKIHRGSVMRKMRASSFAHLVNMASRLRIARPLVTTAA
jgi:FixJ family two-component response regulator